MDFALDERFVNNAVLRILFGTFTDTSLVLKFHSTTEEDHADSPLQSDNGSSNAQFTNLDDLEFFNDNAGLMTATNNTTSCNFFNEESGTDYNLVGTGNDALIVPRSVVFMQPTAQRPCENNANLAPNISWILTRYKMNKDRFSAGGGGNIRFLSTLLVHDIAAHHAARRYGTSDSHSAQGLCEKYEFNMVKSLLSNCSADATLFHENYNSGNNFYSLLQKIIFLAPAGVATYRQNLHRKRLGHAAYISALNAVSALNPNPPLTGALQSASTAEFLHVAMTNTATNRKPRYYYGYVEHDNMLDVKKELQKVGKRRRWNYYVLFDFLNCVLSTEVGRCALNKMYLIDSISGIFDYFKQEGKEHIYESTSPAIPGSAAYIVSRLNRISMLFEHKELMQNALKTSSDWDEVRKAIAAAIFNIDEKFNVFFTLPEGDRIILLDEFDKARSKFSERAGE